jgi:hypothetical protein
LLGRLRPLRHLLAPRHEIVAKRLVGGPLPISLIEGELLDQVLGIGGLRFLVAAIGGAHAAKAG